MQNNTFFPFICEDHSCKQGKTALESSIFQPLTFLIHYICFHRKSQKTVTSETTFQNATVFCDIFCIYSTRVPFMLSRTLCTVMNKLYMRTLSFLFIFISILSKGPPIQIPPRIGIGRPLSCFYFVV